MLMGARPCSPRTRMGGRTSCSRSRSRTWSLALREGSRVVEVQRAGLVETEHLHEAPEGQVLAEHEGEIHDLAAVEVRAEPPEEIIVDAGRVAAEPGGVLEGDAL